MDSLTLNKVSAILITKEKEYPKEVLKNIESVGFGEILIIKNCDGIYRRYDAAPAFPDIYVQDDDCIPDIRKVFSEYDGSLITCGMTEHHLAVYSGSRICLIGHGAFFPKNLIESLGGYRRKFGMDDDYIVETDRIFTFLNFPQKRVETNPVLLSSSYSNDRLSMRKNHYSYLSNLEKKLMKFYCFSISRENCLICFVRYYGFLFRRIFIQAG